MPLALKSVPTTARTFEECYRTHRHTVYRLGLRYGGGSAMWAEDLTHDVFYRLLVHLPKLDARGDLGGWLHRVAANLALKRLRQERSIFGRVVRLLKGDPIHSSPGLDALLSQKQDAAAALRALERLAPKERVVASLHLMEGRNQAEICEVLSMS